MIPVLFPSDNMKYDRLGMGKLFDVQSCIVHEELNGDYSMEFKYPITGAANPYMRVGYTIMAVCPRYVPTTYLPYWSTVDGEMFDIYSVSLPIDGVLTVKCRHVSRRLSNSVCSQTRIQTQAPQTIVNSFAIPNPTIDGQIMFQLMPDSAPSKTFEVYTLKSVLARIIGSEGSLVTNGCDVGFNCHTDASYNASRGVLVDTYVTSHRGADRGAEVRYGINMTNIDQTEDNTGTFNAYVPFWKADEYSSPVYYSGVVQPTTPITPVVAVPLDLSTVFESQPTTAQMEAYARALLDSTMPWIGSDTLTVDFINGVEIDPHGTPISLGDTVHVYWGDAKIAKPMRVVAYDYDVLAEKYIKLELGTQETEFVATTEDFSGVSASGGGGGGGGSEGVVLKEITFPTNWHDTGNGYHTCTPTIAGGHSPSWKIDLQPTEAQLVQMQRDGVNALYVKNNVGTLTAYAVGAAPSESLTMQCTVGMSDSLSAVLGDTVGVGNTQPTAIADIELPLSWNDTGNGYYTATPTVSGVLISASAKIDLQPTQAQIMQLQSDGVSALYVENNAQTLTAYAVGAAPTTAMTMQCTVMGVTEVPPDNPYLDLIYPVGSIYMSVTSANPANLFGGTWEQIQNNALYIEKEPLWANPNPGSEFAAQTVSLNLSGYSAILLVNRHWTNNTLRRTHYIPIDGMSYCCPVQNATGSWVGRTCYATSSGVTFDSGIGATGASTTAGGIPQEIYGVKSSGYYVWKRTA